MILRICLVSKYNSKWPPDLISNQANDNSFSERENGRLQFDSIFSRAATSTQFEVNTRKNTPAIMKLPIFLGQICSLESS